MSELNAEVLRQFAGSKSAAATPEAGLSMAITAALSAGCYRLGEERAHAIVLANVCASFRASFGSERSSEIMRDIADHLAKDDAR